jgi:uncharacterized protein YqgV (UPF0045/DUF77 family)
MMCGKVGWMVCSLEIIPNISEPELYRLVDWAIELIKNSGVKYGQGL